MSTVRCAGPCDRDLEQNEVNFARRKRFVRMFGHCVMAFDRKCRRCTFETLSSSRRRVSNEARSALLAHGKKTCRHCDREKYLREFREIREGIFRSYCKTCDRLMVSKYRETKKYARWKLESRERRAAYNAAWAARNREKTRAWYKRYRARLTPEQRYLMAKASGVLRAAIADGSVVQARSCSRCKLGVECRVRAYFRRGHRYPLDVEWVCYSHHYALARGQAIKVSLEEGRSSETDALCVEAWEWNEIHDQHRAEIDVELGPIDEDYARERAGYLERFKAMPIANARRPSYAELMLIQAQEGEPDYE